MNIGVTQIRGVLLKFLLGKISLLYLCQTLPSISKITPDYIIKLLIFITQIPLLFICGAIIYLGFK